MFIPSSKKWCCFFFLASIIFTKAGLTPLPMQGGVKIQAVKNAVILFDQFEEQQTLVLKNEWVANQELDGLFFIALPSEPLISNAPSKLFDSVENLIKAHNLKHPYESIIRSVEDFPVYPLYRMPPLNRKIKSPDYTLLYDTSLDSLISQFLQYKVDKHITFPVDLTTLKKVWGYYLGKNFKHFLIVRVPVGKELTQMEPLVLDFSSDAVYYPLKGNIFHEGTCDEQFTLLSRGRIPSHRFKQIGFLSSEQISLNENEIASLWDGLLKRSQSALNFQVFSCIDSENIINHHKIRGIHLDWVFLDWVFWGNEFYFVPNYNYLYQIWNPEKVRRFYWAHDIEVSLLWGKDKDPEYEVFLWPQLFEAFGGLIWYCP